MCNAFIGMTRGPHHIMSPKSRVAPVGLRVLIVEDEAAIAMLLEDMLTDLGLQVVGPAGRLPQAIRMAETESFDFAIVDVNVAGEEIYPVVEILARRGIGFVFSTGYGSAGIDISWQDRPVLQKPFSQAELEAAVEAVSPRP